MTGGGKQKDSASSNSWKYTSTKVCRFIKKQAVSAANRFIKLFEKLSLNAAREGSILIEFAVCMPVLIILLYYINDLSKLKRYYDQTEFVAQQMVNILQNISQNREGDEKKIREPDLKRAASLAFLSMYPGNTMYHTDTRSSKAHELSHQPEFFIHYIKGLPDGKASCMWTCYYWCNTGTSPNGWIGSTYKSNQSSSIVRWGTGVIPSAIYPTLKIKEGEIKIIVEITPWCTKDQMSTRDYNASDDNSTCARKAFRFRMVTPKVQGSANYFNSVAIFTPAPCLFDEKTPPQ